MSILAVINDETNGLSELINEIKKEAEDAGVELAYYPSYGLLPNDIPSDVIVVIFDALKNITYSGIYDAIKFFVVSFKAKWEKTFNTKVQKFIFVCNGHKYEFETNIELSQENKDEIITSIAKRIAEG